MQYQRTDWNHLVCPLERVSVSHSLRDLTPHSPRSLLRRGVSLVHGEVLRILFQVWSHSCSRIQCEHLLSQGHAGGLLKAKGEGDQREEIGGSVME